MNLDEMEKTVDLLKAQDDEIIFEDLFSNFGPLIRKCYNKYKLKGYDIDDLYQEGRIVLYKAIQTYQREKSNHFSGYFKLLLCNRLQNLYKKDTAFKRGGRMIPVSLDACVQANNHEVVDCSGVDLIEDCHQVAPEYLAIMREEILIYLADLSKLEKTVLAYYLNSVSYEVIAKEMNLSERQVKSALQRARRKLKMAVK